MERHPDVTDKLVHFTSGVSVDQAFGRLRQIIAQRRLLGGDSRIRGNYRCVCFCEAPVVSSQHLFVKPDIYSRYSPFGILFEKKWLFEQGGRPVIYQPDSEFDFLPPQLRWRHVAYQPGTVDFTWEREWRIQCDELHFESNVSGIIVPEMAWADELVAEHGSREKFEVYQYPEIVDHELDKQYCGPIPWRIYVMSIGVEPAVLAATRSHARAVADFR